MVGVPGDTGVLPPGADPWTAAAMRIAAALGRYWEMRAPTEGRQWLEALTARGGAGPTASRRARVVAGRLAFVQADDAAAATHFDIARVLSRDGGDRRVAAMALLGLGLVALHGGDEGTAAALCAESLALAEEEGDVSGRSDALEALGAIAHGRGRFDWMAQAGTSLVVATTRYEESLALRRAMGDAWGMARTLLALGDAAMDAEDNAVATRQYDASLGHADDLGDRLGRATALFALGTVASARGAYTRARTLFEECVALSREVGARERTANWLLSLGDMASLTGDDAHARVCYEECERLFHELGDETGAAVMWTSYARLALCAGDNRRAAILAEESIVELRARGNERNIVFALYYLGSAVGAQGDVVRAALLHRQGVTIARRYFRGWYRRHGALVNLWGLAVADAALGRLRYAAHLLGAAEVIHAPTGRTFGAWEQQAHYRTIASLRAHLGDDGLDAAWAEGKEMSMDHALSYALGAMDAPTGGDRVPDSAPDVQPEEVS